MRTPAQDKPRTLHCMDNVYVYPCRMPFRFCPQCGSKLQPAFKFCPSCGEQLPSPADECGPVGTTSSTSHSPLRRDEATISVAKTSQALSTSNDHRESKGFCSIYEITNGDTFHTSVFVNLKCIHFSSSTASACLNSSIISPRPALRKTRISLRLDRNVKVNTKDVAPPVTLSTHPVADDWTEGNLNGLEIVSVQGCSGEKIHLKFGMRQDCLIRIMLADE